MFKPEADIIYSRANKRYTLRTKFKEFGFTDELSLDSKLLQALCDVFNDHKNVDKVINHMKELESD